jgi:PAS domain S-box-containing protein
MSRSLTSSAADLSDQMVLLVGGAVRLLCGEAGVFVVSNEAFDPQSSEEYTVYRLNEAMLPTFFASIVGGVQPNSARLLVTETLSPSVAAQLLPYDDEVNGNGGRREIERCSLFVHDSAGMLGVLHFLRPEGACSCFEQGDECSSTNGANSTTSVQGSLRLFVAQLAAGLRAALKSQSLVKEQERLAAIFENSNGGILTVDNALRIIDFNPAMERLTGWRESEVLGRFYYDVLRPRDRQGNEVGLEGSPILQAFAGQVVVNREMVIAARDGQRFTVSVTASCVRSARGEPMNGILTIRDITREREQEEQRSTFISVISHELQTPIAIIKGYASTLARTDTTLEPEALRTRLTAIEEEADRLNKLVGNLLYASRIQSGGLQMEIAPLDVASLVETVVRRLQARSPEVTVTLDIPPNLPTAMADRDRIEEVLQNLLDNAIKYSPRRRTISVACRATGEEVILRVSDAGMGIALREQEHIFDRFQRVQNTMTRTIPGAGLGLYICRAIVEAHGGRIQVESALHEGSTFSFSLPREEKAQLPMVVF